MNIKEEYPEFHAAAVSHGCIEGTAEYYGFIEGCQYKQRHVDKLCQAIEQVVETAKEFEKVNEMLKHIVG